MQSTDDPELEGQAQQLIRLAARLIRHVQAEADRMPVELRDLLRAHGLAARHLHAMIPLALEGPMMVSRLAERLALAPASTSQLVSELGAAGLVARDVDPLDRRKARVSLRVHLKTKIAALADSRLRPFRAALVQIPPAERKQFLDGWQVLAASMEAEATGHSHSISREDRP